MTEGSNHRIERAQLNRELEAMRAHPEDRTAVYFLHDMSGIADALKLIEALKKNQPLYLKVKP